MTHEQFMSYALEMAKESYDDGEVPVGAVIVKNGEIIAKGRNRREKEKNALLHAEIDAINNACKALNGWRLWECEIYVTLEPCPMCAGAIINAHIPNVYF
ncbi:MAG: nucleoside deaminase, partial [Clostridia bacterium]|nr:nucleoside deaminase [Clostridia bacterium]